MTILSSLNLIQIQHGIRIRLVKSNEVYSLVFRRKNYNYINNWNQDDDDFDDMPRRKTRKPRINNTKQNKRNTTRDNNSASNFYNDEGSKRNGLDSSVTVTPQSNLGSSTSTDSQASDQPNEFQSGDFIICRQDVLQDWPALWRVDGKTLLQKFEPFQSHGKMIYRSISTVSSSNAIYLETISFERQIVLFFKFSMPPGRPKVDVYICWQNVNILGNFNMKCMLNCCAMNYVRIQPICI